jgi:hypothetical protein
LEKGKDGRGKMEEGSKREKKSEYKFEKETVC